MATIGELLVEINGDNSGLNKTLKGTESSLMGAVGKMAGAIGGLSLAWKAVDLAMKGIDYNKAAEQAEISFGVFLGSAGAAKSMIEELRDLAKETPLEFAEVRDAAKRLSAFGIEANKIIPSMRMLADVSAGLQIPMGDLAYLFGTIKTQGKAMTVDINQFANRGIPIWTELAKVTGKAGTELRKLVEEGGIGFPQIEQAFKNMTSEGGKFFNMAVKQMDSLAGSQSNLNDNTDVWLGTVTEALTGPLKLLQDWASHWFSTNSAQLKQNGKEWQDLFEGIAKSTGWGKYNAQVQAHWKDVITSMRLTYVDQQKLLDQAILIAQTYPEIHKKNNSDIGKTITELSNKYGLTTEEIKKILLNVDSVDGKTKKLIASNVNLTAKAVDYGERIAYANSLQGEAVAAYQKEIDKQYDLNESKKIGNIFQGLQTSLVFATNSELSKSIDKQAEIEDTVERVNKLAEDKVISDAKEATGRQIVLGYQNQAIKNQIKANDLAEEYNAELAKVAEYFKTAEDSLKTAGSHFSSLSSSMAKFGNEGLATVLKGFGDIATNAGNVFAALGKGDYIAAAVSGVALIADAWSLFWGGQSEEQKKADEAAKKAEADRIEAVKKLEGEYQAKFDNDLTRLEKERDERIAYARSIGADVLNIERYYAGEIAKIRTKSSGTIAEELAIANESKRIISQSRSDLSKQLGISVAALDSFITVIKEKYPTGPLAKVISDSESQLRNSLESIGGELDLFKTRYSQSFDGLGSALTDSLKSGSTLGDFRKTIMDMLRNMAIEAAIIAGGFQEKFKEIGVMIAEALKDGFSETELAAIDLRVNALYSSATSAIDPLNALFNRASTAQNITNGGGTTINIQTTSDPLTIANALSNVQQSLAYEGVVA